MDRSAPTPAPQELIIVAEPSAAARGAMRQHAAGSDEPAPAPTGAGLADPYELAATVEALVAKLRQVARRNRVIKSDPELAELAADALTRARQVTLALRRTEGLEPNDRNRGPVSWRSRRGSPDR